MDVPDRWPLSAAATALLISPKTDASTVLKLSVKELVVVIAWSLQRTVRKRRWRGDEEITELRPGSRPVPGRPPLDHLSDALRAARPEGGPLREVVAATVKSRSDLAESCRRLALEELQQRRLVRPERH